MKKKFVIRGMLFLLLFIIAVYFFVVSEKGFRESYQWSESTIMEPRREEKSSFNEEVLNSLIKHIGFAEEALTYFKIDSADEAIRLWAEGIMEGNGVLQYAVMDKNLQEEFKKYLELKDNITWDTRRPNITIESYQVIEHIDVSEKVKIYKIRFNYIDSGGVLGEVFNDVTILEENYRWVISSIG